MVVLENLTLEPVKLLEGPLKKHNQVLVHPVQQVYVHSATPY